MFSNHFVNEINSFKCRDKMNKRLKDEKIDILIYNDQFIKIRKQHHFHDLEKKHCKSINSMSIRLKQRIFN
jgi:hypothetical protein